MTYHVPAVLAAPLPALPPPSNCAVRILAVAEALQPMKAARENARTAKSPEARNR